MQIEGQKSYLYDLQFFIEKEFIKKLYFIWIQGVLSSNLELLYCGRIFSLFGNHKIKKFDKGRNLFLDVGNLGSRFFSGKIIVSNFKFSVKFKNIFRVKVDI